MRRSMEPPLMSVASDCTDKPAVPVSEMSSSARAYPEATSAASRI